MLNIPSPIKFIIILHTSTKIILMFENVTSPLMFLGKFHPTLVLVINNGVNNFISSVLFDLYNNFKRLV